jgi:hypothetical protein
VIGVCVNCVVVPPSGSAIITNWPPGATAHPASTPVRTSEDGPAGVAEPAQPGPRATPGLQRSVAAPEADGTCHGDGSGVASAHGEGSGRRIAGSLRSPDPTATAPASKPIRSATAASTTSDRPLKPRDRTGSGTGTGVKRAVEPSAAARSAISSQRSGACRRSRLVKRRRRSSIAVTQELAEATPAAA